MSTCYTHYAYQVVVMIVLQVRAQKISMPKFHLTYVIQGLLERRCMSFEHPSARVSSRDVATAIIRHEFPNVVAPVGVWDILTVEQTLENLGVTEVSFPVTTRKGS